MEEKKEIPNNSPLPSPRKLSSNNQLSGSPAKIMSPIDIHNPEYKAEIGKGSEREMGIFI